MKIAAVIPAYNAGAFIEHTIASVLAQTRKPDDIVIVNDASTDNTLERLQDIQRENARRFTIISTPCNSGGPAAPLNEGIRNTDCDWIATLDHDDHWDPKWLAQFESAARDMNVELFLGRVRVSPANTIAQAELDLRWKQLADQASNHILHHKNAYRELVPALSYGITCSNMVFRKRLALKYPFDINVTRCCDYRFLQQVTEEHDIGLLDVVSCDWISRPSSLYQQGSIDRLDRDLLYVYERFDAARLPPEFSKAIAAKCRKTMLDLAYEARRRGDYRQAMNDYKHSLRHGAPFWTAIRGLIKSIYLEYRSRW